MCYHLSVPIRASAALSIHKITMAWQVAKFYNPDSSAATTMWLSNGQLSFDSAATSITGFHRVAFFSAPIAPGVSEGDILAIWECHAYANQTSSCSLSGTNGRGGFELKLFIPLQIGNHYGYATVILKPAFAGPNQLAYPSNSIAFQMAGAGAAATWPTIRTSSRMDVAADSVDNQYLVGWPSPLCHSINNHTSGYGSPRRGSRASAHSPVRAGLLCGMAHAKRPRPGAVSG